MKNIICFAFLFFQLVNAAFPATDTVKQASFNLGVVDTLWSKELNEKRAINIYLPPGYDTSKSNYPVIYLLDGSADEDFIHVAGIVQFFTMITGQLPPTIVVGIANVDRRRDYTFPTTISKDKQDFPTTGGSAAFISFIKNDLQPYINTHYRTNENKMIIGQSLGGLVAAEILLKQPQLFTHYLIVSPSLWWDNESLLNLFKDYTANKNVRNICVAVGGKEEDQMVKSSNKLSVMLQKKYPGKVVFNTHKTETHLTILHNAVYKALPVLITPE